MVSVDEENGHTEKEEGVEEGAEVDMFLRLSSSFSAANASLVW